MQKLGQQKQVDRARGAERRARLEARRRVHAARQPPMPSRCSRTKQIRQLPDFDRPSSTEQFVEAIAGRREPSRSRTLPDGDRRAAPSPASAGRVPPRAGALARTSCAPSRSASDLPLLLILLWDRAVALHRHAADPDARRRRGDDVRLRVRRHLRRCLQRDHATHVWHRCTRVYGGFFLAALVGIPLGLLIGRIPLAAAAARSDAATAAADPGDGVAAAVDDPLRARARTRRSSWSSSARSIRSCSTPSSACARSIRGCSRPPSMLGCRGSAHVPRGGAAGRAAAIFTGLRLGLGFAWIVIVVGEMTGVPTGLGAVIMDGRTLSRTELVISGMIVIGVAGFVSDRRRRDAQQPRAALEPAASCVSRATAICSTIRGRDQELPRSATAEIEALRARQSRRSTRASSSA